MCTDERIALPRNALLTCFWSLAHVELPASLLTSSASVESPNAGASTSAQPAVAPSLTMEKKKKHHLTTATDPLFAGLRDLNFSSVGKRLNQIARRLDEDYKVFIIQRLIPNHIPKTLR